MGRSGHRRRRATALFAARLYSQQSRWSVQACMVVCVETNPVQSSPVQSNPHLPTQPTPCSPANFSSFHPEQRTFVQSTPTPSNKRRQHRQVSPFCPIPHPLGPSSICSRCSPLPLCSHHHSPGSGDSIGSSQNPAVLPVNDDSTLRVSTLLKAQQQQIPSLLLRWIRPFEACDRGFPPFGASCLPLPSPRPS